MPGIAAFGAYLPWRRLTREAIASAHAWTGTRAVGRGARTMACWDEDAITMAVEAARACIAGEPDPIASLVLASTTLPFADRLNAGVVAGALALGEAVEGSDVTGSLRAGVGALACALAAKPTLVVAADRRAALPMSPQETQIGHGAAAVITSADDGIAAFLGSATSTVDFVDHYREAGADFDYEWEERWVRDEGVKKIVPATVLRALEASGVAAADVTHFIFPSTLRNAGQDVARLCGIAPERVVDTLAQTVGDTGAAHPLLLLCATLERAKPGALIVLAAFGQGCDALVFRATAALAKHRSASPLARQLDGGFAETSYMKHLVFSGLVPWDKGKRAERDKQTALSVLYRKRDMLTALVGGSCRECGTRQFPRTRTCINPNCRAVDSQDPFRFADEPARIVSCSADHLTFTPDPPLRYGIVAFEGGGRLMMEFVDSAEGELEIDAPVRMVFRVKDYDERRGFRRYFWKAAPMRAG